MERIYTPEEATNERKEIPRSILKQVYDTDDNVLFGSRYTKGKVSYNYIPAERMSTGRPYIIDSSISYDGKGNVDLPKDALLMPFNKLSEMFPDNEFVI